jgi:hypothetical protein
MRYAGIADPDRAFESLRPYRKAIIALMIGCRPFGPDYCILLAAQEALDAAAAYFTGEQDFYSLRPERSVGEHGTPP